VTARQAIAASAAAIVLGVAWPWFAAQRAQATAVPSAPIPTDYLQRDRLIAFYERRVKEDPQDQISARTLASEYLQRFRESGDIGDVTRAHLQGERSLKLQPQGNVQALGVIASADVAFHRFGEALNVEKSALRAEPFDENAWAQTASILMELGRYPEAERILARPHTHENPTWISIESRRDELSGNLVGALIQMESATRLVDRMIELPAYTRSWYHLRIAQLSFESGDGHTAEAQFAEALKIYPDNAAALLWQAKYYRARRDWVRTLASATRSSDLYPLPQALGYVADAQRALGNADAARKTDALIRAEQRLFNVQGVNDRLLAMYYAEHHEHLTDALTAARSDLVKRGNEIYADDTMAWVLASMGRWRQALPYAEKATRYGTQDPELQYHVGVIAWHSGRRAEARTRLNNALAIDGSFHPFYADDARALLQHP
jgi:tetratricopeptide (TPR) repeat protein